MESVLEKVHKGPLWRDYSQKNMYEDRWLGSEAFTKYLAEQRAVHRAFMESVGLVKKP